MPQFDIYQPDLLPALPDPSSQALLAIRNPINSAPLHSLARDAAAKGQTAAVLVDDLTRATPVRLLLPILLKELSAGGLPDNHVIIAVALGSHRTMTKLELTTRLGEEILSRYRVINQPAEDMEEFQYAGVSEEGIPAWINRKVWESGLRIGLGTVTPHMDAGFSGGAKIIMPGMCAMPTIDAFHVRLAWHPLNHLGNVDSPLRKDLESFTTRFCPLHFMLNVVTNLGGEMIGCFAGDSMNTHRRAVDAARRSYGTRLARRFPIVLAHCRPYDHDLWQACKGLWCGEAVTKDSGILIISGGFPEGYQRYPHLPEYLGCDPDKLFAEIQAGAAIDPKAAATAMVVGRMKQRIRIAVVSPGITPDEADLMGLAYFSDAETALQVALEQLPEDERAGAVALLPYAGVTLPLFNV